MKQNSETRSAAIQAVDETERIYEVAWPRGEQEKDDVSPAKRLDTLAGKTIGFVWDWVYRGDEIFPLIEAELTARYPGIRFIGYEEFGNPHSAHEAEVFRNLPELAAKHGCDAFIVGIGC